jgi:UDP-N-acetylmuramoyl-tripeptide--D-alanyl-D-alanine ligase
VLAAQPPPTVLVLGDMGEVGEAGPAYHREVGGYAREHGIGALFTLGEASREAAGAFGAGARHFATPEELVRALPAAGSILVKGSRFMRMERVVAALTGQTERTH